MAVYFITGSLGGGKSLAGVDKVSEYLRDGRKIATNVNLNLEYLCSPDNRHSRVTRIPDAPSLTDLRAIGYGSDDATGNSNGLLLLDELGTWFNARDFQDKGRLKVIKHIIHLRKLRWDVMFLVQDFSMVDKQVRGNITQFLVTCQSSKDHFIFKLVPKFHIATVRLRSKVKVATWFYRGAHLYPAYDTEQRYFTDDEDDSDIEIAAALLSPEMAAKEQGYRDKNVPHSLLPPAYWDEETRMELRLRTKKIYSTRYKIAAGMALCIGLVITMFRSDPLEASSEAIPSSVEEVLTLVPEIREAESEWLDLTSYSIKHHQRIGSKTKFTFEDMDGNLLKQSKLESLGYKVTSRGRNEALVIFPDYSFFSIYGNL